MAAGNWTPELIDLAGGEDVFGTPGVHSPWITWDDLLARDPDVIIVAPCGFDLARTRAEMHWMADRPEFGRLKAVRTGRVFLADGNQYFNRPGPRVAETFEFIRQMVHEGYRCGLRRGSYTQGKSTRPMASIILKGLTVAAGLGLAIGIGSGNRRTEENHMGTKLPDDGSEAGPIAERLDRIEARMSAIEGRSRISAGSEAGRRSRRFTHR